MTFEQPATAAKTLIALVPAATFAWMSDYPWIPSLVALGVLNILDLISGVIASRDAVTSDRMFGGMRRKAMMWIYLCTGGVLGALTGVPGMATRAISVIAVGYAIVEAWSIIENGIRAGLKPPPFLQRLLEGAGKDDGRTSQ